MTTISVDVRDVVGAGASGIVTIRANPARPGDTGYISGQLVTAEIVDGVGALTGVAPGPAEIRVKTTDPHWSGRWQVIVPDQPTVTLAALVDDQTVWPAPVVREAQQARDAAVAAAVRAESVEVIDDTTTDTSTTWSSTKIAAQVATRAEDQFYVVDEDTGDLEPMDGVSLTMGAAMSWAYTLGALSVAANAETVARAAAARSASAARVSLDGPVTVGVAPLSKAVRTATGTASTTTMTITLDTPSTSGPVTARARTCGSDGALIPQMADLCTIPAGTTVATFPRYIIAPAGGFITVEVVSAGLGATGLTTHFHD